MIFEIESLTHVDITTPGQHVMHVITMPYAIFMFKTGLITIYLSEKLMFDSLSLKWNKGNFF